MLKEGSFQMSAPTLTTTINGKQKTLYLEKIAKTHDNLNKKLGEILMTLMILKNYNIFQLSWIYKTTKRFQ